jgi:hypothetical protein
MLDDDYSSMTPDERESYDVELAAEHYRPVVERVLVIEGLSKHAQHLRVPMTHATHESEYVSVLASRVASEISSAEHRLASLRSLLKDVERVERGELS